MLSPHTHTHWHTHRHTKHARYFPKLCALCLSILVIICLPAFSPGGTRKRSSLIGLISMPEHPLCPAVPQLIVLGSGINNIYFSKSHHYLSLNLFLSGCLPFTLSLSLPFLFSCLHPLLPRRRAPFRFPFSPHFRSSCLVPWKVFRENHFHCLLWPILALFCPQLPSLMSASSFTASLSIH